MAETIFALSSGAPPAAIAIVRISGPDAFSTLEAMTGRVPPPRRFAYAALRSPQGDILDRALVAAFPGPGNATGEDLAELHLHGGKAVVHAVLAQLEKRPGLRAAEAGEFTRRAFLNGRIDLGQAEALSDLLAAETEWQRRAATDMAGGRFSGKIEEWRVRCLRLSAAVEAELDFSDEDDVGNAASDALSAAADLAGEIDAVLAQPAVTRLRDGIRVVLAGPPNSGKSTLLNALAARDAAIVSDVAGTTRDVIEVAVAIGGIPFLIVDTAGLRDQPGDDIERIGIDRANRAIAAADIVLWLGPEGDGPRHEGLIEIDAKCDRGRRKSTAALPLSASANVGMTELLELLEHRSRELIPGEGSFALNERQRSAMRDASEALRSAGQQDDLLVQAEELRRTRSAFDRLTGRSHTEDLLDHIFSGFCIGK